MKKLVIVLALILTLAASLAAFAETGDISLDVNDLFTIAVSDVTLADSTATLTVTGTAGDSFTVYAALFDGDGRLIGLTMTAVTLEAGTQTVTLENVSDGTRLFFLDSTLRPLCEDVILRQETGFTASFAKGEGASVTVYYTQDTTGASEENASSAVARNGSTGEIDTTGDGQINFAVVVEEGYVLKSVTVEPTANYKNLKTVDAAANLYRITKVTGGLTVTITTEEATEETGDGIIHFNGDSIDATGIDGVSVNGTTLTITAAGTYYLEGTLTDGQIAVSTPAKTDAVILVLDNVSVTCSTGHALNATCGTVTVTNSDGESAFTSTADSSAGIYSKNDLTIKGAGTLTVTSALGNGIRCKADLEIGAGDLIVNAYNNGVKGDESVKITKKATNITVTAETGDAIKTDCIDETTNTIEYGKGSITVNGGTLILTAAGDGIQADDTVTVAGGSITITSGTEGIKANTVNVTATNETTGDTYTVEGNIVISGGSVTVTSGEDGIKGAGNVTISGGSVTVIAENDGIQAGVDYTDANGDTVYSTGELLISGGAVNVTAGGGASASRSDEDSHKGIKAVSELNITGGDVTVDSYDDAIHSNYNVTVAGGTFELASGDDGVHADFTLTMGTEDGGDDDYYMNISKSYEALEGSVIKYLSGTTFLTASDDGVNAAGDYAEDGTLNTSSTSTSSGGTNSGGFGGFGGGPNPGTDDSTKNGMLYLKGGLLYVIAGGDGLDSNGDIAMSGGTVIVNGPTTGGNGVFDKGDNNNTFTVTGGTLVGFGISDMIDNPTSVSGQGYYSSTGSSSSSGGGRPGGMGGGSSTSSIRITKGTAISITTDSGYLTIVPEISVSSGMLYVTCGDMTSGRTYSTASYNGYASGTQLLGHTVGGTWYGLYQSF